MVTINADNKPAAAAPGVGQNNTYVPPVDSAGSARITGSGIRNLMQKHAVTLPMSAEAKKFVEQLGTIFKENGSGIQLEPTAANGTYVVHRDGKGVLLYFSLEVPPTTDIGRHGNQRWIPRDYAAHQAAESFNKVRGSEIKLLTSPIQILKPDYERAAQYAETLRTALMMETAEYNLDLQSMYSPDDALVVSALGRTEAMSQLAILYPSRILPRTEFGALLSYTQRAALQNPNTLGAAISRANDSVSIALVVGYTDVSLEAQTIPVPVSGYNGIPMQSMQQVARYRPLVCISAIASPTPTLLNLIIALAAGGGERILNYRHFVTQFDNYGMGKRPNLGYLNPKDAAGKYALAADRSQTEAILSQMLTPALALDVSHGMPNPPAMQFLQRASDPNNADAFNQFVREMNRLFPSDPANAYTVSMGTPLWRVCEEQTGIIGDMNSGNAALTTEFGLIDLLSRGSDLGDPEKALLLNRRPENEDMRMDLLKALVGDVTPLFSTKRYLVNPTWLHWVCKRLAERKFVVANEAQQQMNPYTNVWSAFTGVYDQLMASGLHPFAVSNQQYGQNNGYVMNNMMYYGGHAYQQPGVMVQPQQTMTGF